ncbi:MAG TPA: alpha/beta fold hydrolase [Verrucomicrobiae bacterium]|nr:alpha/beta fold hydrolase [Verrucomicrobiae bacterium]
MKSWKGPFIALSIFAWCGCAHLATVKITEPRVPTIAASEDRLTLAKQHLVAAERAQPLVALGDDLSAAQLALNILEQRRSDSSAQCIYNFAVARAVENVGRAQVQPWRKPITVDLGKGNHYTLTSPKPVDPDHDPSRYDLFPTDSLKTSGKFFESRSSVNGVGAPLVAVAHSENPQFRQQYRLPRIYAPVTATIRFSDESARLEFIDPLRSEQVTVGKRVFPLAVDLSASTAMLIACERPERLGFSRVMNPEKFANTARLIQLQRFDPDRTPVILVHGLQETPASWAPMINSLRDDPAIRKRYQFWFFSYPSGYPYPYSAALFRRELDGVKRAFPNHKRVILIGHSMGGLICRLMMTDAGDTIWRDFVGTSPAKTPLSSDTRKLLEEVFVFNHRPGIERVIFVSTPHRGSKMASGWLGRFGAGLVHTPRLFNPIYAAVKPLLITNPAARPLNRMPNSVDTLEPNDRFLQSVNKLPIAPGISYHSIIGDRGQGDTPNSSDGIVPYWSSHLDSAQSELIVHSGHGAQYNPEAIQEVARILKLDPRHSKD